MKLKMYSIRDAKGEVYNVPFFQKTHGEAERNFTELVRDEKSMISKYPDDYDLYYLGQYDDNSGLVEPLDTPEHVQKAAHLKPRASIQ